MPLPLIPIAIAVLAAGGIFTVRKKGAIQNGMLSVAARTQRKHFQRRVARRCLDIFQDYALYAGINVLLLLIPVIIHSVPGMEERGVSYLATCYVLVMARMAFSVYSVLYENWKYLRELKVKQSFYESMRGMLRELVREEVAAEARWLPWKHLFSEKLLNDNEASIKKELANLGVRMLAAFLAYVSITHFLSAPIMFGAGEMPLWKSTLYPFVHSIEITWDIFASESWKALLIMATGFFLYTETAASIARITRDITHGLPAVFFAAPAMYFSYALLSAAHCQSAEVYTLFLAYAFFSRTILEKSA